MLKNRISFLERVVYKGVQVWGGGGLFFGEGRPGGRCEVFGEGSLEGGPNFFGEGR